MSTSTTTPGVESAVRAAHAAFLEWREMSGAQRAGVLEALAAGLEQERGRIVAQACAETALTAEEFAPEFARMVRTFRMFAGVLREGSWVRAAVDRPRADAGDAIGPNHDVRRMLLPLGVCAVFGASNFPLSYGVCGGDTASALAAGCGVVVKEHPAHPRLGRLVHGVASRALSGAGAPDGLLGYVENEDPRDLSVARALVQHERVQAVGFTGSIKGGMALVELANARAQPIPVFAEMGSTNPVFVLPGALKRDAAGTADKVADAVLARVGQQCTKPGLVFYEPGGADAFGARLRERFSVSPARAMLAPWVRGSFEKRASEIEAAGVAREAAGSGAGANNEAARPRLWSADLGQWLEHGSLQEEAFGPGTIAVRIESWDDIAKVELHGHLTVTLLMDEQDPRDLELARDFMQSKLAQSAGRIVINGVPTGVRVCHGMVHGGPYPATNRPDTTAVGPFAIERWCRPVCFQNVPQALLPDELKDANPLGIGRFEDGVYAAGRG